MNIAMFFCLAYLFIGRGYYVVSGFTSVEVVTIVLAALGVLLTALGIFIAMLAVWGYQSLHSLSGEIARKTAENLVRSELPAMVSREMADQLALKNSLGTTSRVTDDAQAIVNSLDGDEP
ncbi:MULTISPECIES: hypothetical protein [unclassified Mesorhizobium]|uniref:hypothetical protein n=1 Tax=unclassified Mesorhizobium TaxID=325217 RepID=UPI00112A6A04|nr:MULTISPECIES: hypothetical protein [unclassified Mesorhizobium]TPJ46413.1 hypothetical protein FJ437_14565 [Mesorhizobium sp. B2-6-6]MBZ9960339.1 hypothetical protein [Mesorhizobium sp. BR1-1-14]MCA0003455.1 hypothetical protein [Mesorhizobium sp. B264B2A]MCA0009800.1 hypothetical protein [Mesorhizobium sp. B264B1B]MCA0020207.1 hypothetical protein [Mesorhizobium sp. B264B1A]